MAYKRKRGRGRRRYRKRRKMNFTRRVKRVVKKEFKKRIEMKHVRGVVALAPIGAFGSLISLLPTIPQGTDHNDRIGTRINLHLMKLHAHIQGPTGGANAFILRCRVIVCYCKQAPPLLTDFPPTIDGFMNYEGMRTSGMYVMSDRTHTLAPCCPTVIAVADTYSYWAAAQKTNVTLRKTFRLRGRREQYEEAGGVQHGFYYLFALSDVNGGEVCAIGTNSLFFFTDP